MTLLEWVEYAEQKFSECNDLLDECKYMDEEEMNETLDYVIELLDDVRLEWERCEK